ncbi:MAG: hypothetical protein LBS66_01525, partial [Rhodospirillaceae bacterium]|nr:hypothetical protein [Rhodospirillaceae bacterium]
NYRYFSTAKDVLGGRSFASVTADKFGIDKTTCDNKLELSKSKKKVYSSSSAMIELSYSFGKPSKLK